MLNITLLHPVTLTKDLVLEVPCYSIPREHRMNGGPSLAEIERAILEPPSSSAQGKALNSTKNTRLDTIFVEVKTIPPKEPAHVADTYGVARTAMPVETRPGLFMSARDSTRPTKKSRDPRRARKAPEEELQEDEEILSRLMEWKGFYGGFEGLQAAYRPISQLLPAEASRADPKTRSTPNSAPTTSGSVSATELAEQKKAEQQTLEERLAAEREYWRKRREMENVAKREEEAGTATAATPSSTLLKRLLKREQQTPAPEAATSSPSSASSPVTSGTHTAPVQQTPPVNAEPVVQLNAAQRRSIERVIAQQKAEASPAAKVKKLIAPAPQRAEPTQEQSTATKGFTNAQREEKEAGLLQRVANWFTRK